MQSISVRVEKHSVLQSLIWRVTPVDQGRRISSPLPIEHADGLGLLARERAPGIVTGRTGKRDALMPHDATAFKHDDHAGTAAARPTYLEPPLEAALPMPPGRGPAPASEGRRRFAADITLSPDLQHAILLEQSSPECDNQTVESASWRCKNPNLLFSPAARGSYRNDLQARPALPCCRSASSVPAWPRETVRSRPADV